MKKILTYIIVITGFFILSIFSLFVVISLEINRFLGLMIRPFRKKKK